MTTVHSHTRTPSRRHRHRSPRQKFLESVLLILGVPALLFTVLALSVELIEYRPSSRGVEYSRRTHGVPDARPSTSRRSLPAVVESSPSDSDLSLEAE